ncbi:MAG: choice-of-anchor Q domain-containing protein, partial [Paludibacter sp.]
IQNCHNVSTTSSGGGVKLFGAGTTLQNCIITACTSATGGTGASAGITLTGGATLKDSYIHHNTNASTAGGVSVYGNTCVVSGCKIDNNTATDGGGLYLYSNTSGVSISNCSFNSNSSTSAANGGAAIGSYVTVTNALPISIADCSFSSNTAVNSGGAIFLDVRAASTLNITRCTFTTNTSSAASTSAKGGGAIIANNCVLIIDKCSFTGNQSISGGGAVLLANASTTITASKFIANSAAGNSGGSAIYCKTNYTANNCLFADNTGSTPIHFYTSTAVSTFQNCTFANNLTSAAAAAPIQLLNIGAGPTYPKYVFSNCLFYNVSGFSAQSGPTTTTCASDKALSSISIKTITAADFVDATNATVASRNYQLSTTSLAIDAGTDLTNATSPVTKDILDVTRPQGGAYDIGAYELPFYNTTVTFNSFGTVNSYTTGDVDLKAQGTQLAFTITPNPGYKITSVLYNGTEVKGDIVGGVYTAPAIVANATLVVQFDLATGLEKAQNDFQCFSGNQSVEVRGAKVGDEISIFSINGAKIKSAKVNSNNMSIPLTQGMYFVRIANSIQKVAIK